MLLLRLDLSIQSCLKIAAVSKGKISVISPIQKLPAFNSITLVNKHQRFYPGRDSRVNSCRIQQKNCINKMV